ncbi:type II toxin-antitoxin system RelE/ParE family toxin [Gloeobacter morelensis]|uniref:Type II toxin-antitoxin system RelE/ParE family toxin n=1 Tax=Gloeobacter morelensis MG652769 TaxID=2781736 RepID=A0ABY3PLY6_9CYAN|nr:type II toxin-antitoxin system RelE/ParE family toxin [Gloeobacter morelensis]UFP94696.1 type II toxin-antitoxin system RelE/ParE family toxin [Gloeobacter morelensis MG652769]
MAGVTIFWAPTALEDLAALRANYPSPHPEVKSKALSRLEAVLGNLAVFPDMGRPGSIEGTREFAVSGTPFILVYRWEPQRLVVLAVRDGRMDPQAP